jgi:type VI secretion system protein ImpJ
MHLSQHHFQAQLRYFEELVSFARSGLFLHAYGLAGYELDGEALLNGTVALVHARGIMPDGLVFQFPEDRLPEPREIRDLFSPTQDSHRVLLAIPAQRADAPNATLEDGAGGAETRYRALSLPVPDEATGRDERPVRFASKSFRLVLDSEDLTGLVTLPLARVRRDGAGHFVYDPAFVPPCLQIGASPRMMELLGRLVEGLEARADALAAERRGRSGEVGEYAAREIVGYWLSHAVNSALAPLAHLYRQRRAHPAEVFLEMSRLAGALCTFSMTAHPRDLPLYDHDDLERSFGGLERFIRDHLDVIIPRSAVTIPFEAQADYLFAATVADARCFGRSRWFLGVRGGVAGAEMSARVLRLVKVCSGKHIARLVSEGLPGLALEHVPVAPAEISPRAGTEYFAILPAGPCWSSIVETHEVGVYVPSAIPDAQLELVVQLQ